MRIPIVAPHPGLSPRQKQVCALIARAKTNQQIGAALSVSPGTIKTYLGKIFLKTGCHNRTELAVFYSTFQGASGKPIRAKSNNKPRL